MYGKVQHIQDKLHKTIQPPAHGFKQQDHLQSHPNRISLEGTIRANPFYQQDRNSSSVRSSLADVTTATAAAAALAEAINEEVPKTMANGLTSHGSSTPSSSRGSSESIDRDSYKSQGMMTPATSPEVGGLKDRLPSATTRSITAAAAAALAAKHNQQISPMSTFNDGDELSREPEPLSPSSKKRTSVGSLNGATNRQFHVYGDMQQKSADVSQVKEAEEDEEDDEEDDEEEERKQLEQVYMRPRQPRPMSTANRHSIFVDEAAQAMDALSRARHRQSMRIEGNDDEDEDDEDEYDDDDLTQGIEPPEKWHYSDLEDDYDDEEDDDDEDDDEDEYTEDGERKTRRRRKHESFMSAKSVLPPNGSTVSLVDAYANDTQDEDDESERGTDNKKDQDTNEQLVQSLEVQDEKADISRESDVADLIPAGAGSNDDDDYGEDEDESEDSDDLEDNDDEEGQDRRIYLQQLRAQKREARRLERLAEGKNKKGGKGGKLPSLDSTTDGSVKKKTLKKGHSKENLRNRDPDRPQTPTTPVPTTQVIPLTPTDLVLIRQKLFAAGNFEASMRMLDTIFHAAMAKMVEGRERGVQTEAVSFLEDGEQAVVASEHKQSPSKGVEASSTTCTTSTSTSTSTDDDASSLPQKQLRWVNVGAETAVAPVKAVAHDDDDDEDRVVEWLLGGV